MGNYLNAIDGIFLLKIILDILIINGLSDILIGVILLKVTFIGGMVTFLFGLFLIVAGNILLYKMNK